MSDISWSAADADEAATGVEMTINFSELADKLETAYAFECEAGPLKNCVDWQTLRREAARLEEFHQAYLAFSQHRDR